MAAEIVEAMEMHVVDDDKKKGTNQTRVTILFPPELATRIRALAESQAVPFTVLLRQWIVQRLEEEEREAAERRGQR